MEMTMYDTLLQLPLFQGLAKNDFTSILDKVKIHFLKRKAGDTVALGGEDCRELVFLLNGSLVSKTSDRDELYTFYEAINAPFLIEPYSLFGWSTKYVSTYTALTACNLVTIEKAYLLSELNNYEIIRLNYLNILSNRAQNLHDRLWTNLPESLHDRIVEFILLHSYVPGGEKRLKIKMDDLAKLLSSTRIRVPDISLLKEHRDMRLSE